MNRHTTLNRARDRMVSRGVEWWLSLGHERGDVGMWRGVIDGVDGGR